MGKFRIKEINKQDESDLEKNSGKNEEVPLKGTINPTSYPINLVAYVIFYFSLFLNAVMMFVVVGYFKNAHPGNKKDAQFLIISHIFGTSGSVVMFNCYVQPENQVQTRVCWFFYIYLLLILLHIPAFIINLDEYPSPAFTSLLSIVFLFNLALFPKIYNIVEHCPIKEEQDKLVKERFYEERSGEEKYLSVKESRAFRIVVENSGNEEISAFKLLRLKDNGEKSDDVYVKGNFLLDVPLRPGESLVIIPETHEEPGAIKAVGYRSFGIDKCLHLKTIITFTLPNSNEENSVTYHEIYKQPIEKKRKDSFTAFIEERE